MKTIPAVSAMLLAALLVGCGGVRRLRPADGPLALPEIAAITVRATNHNWLTVDVYSYANGQRTLLGLLETGRSATYRLPRYAVLSQDLELLVEPVGSSAQYMTGPMLANPGAAIELVVENALDLTHYSVDGVESAPEAP